MQTKLLLPGRVDIDKVNIPDGILITQNEKFKIFILESLAKIKINFMPPYRSLFL